MLVSLAYIAFKTLCFEVLLQSKVFTFQVIPYFQFTVQQQLGGAPSPSSSAPWKPHRKALGTCNIITLFLNPVRGKTSDATPAPEGHSVLDIFLLFFSFLLCQNQTQHENHN